MSDAFSRMFAGLMIAADNLEQVKQELSAWRAEALAARALIDKGDCTNSDFVTSAEYVPYDKARAATDAALNSQTTDSPEE